VTVDSIRVPPGELSAAPPVLCPCCTRPLRDQNSRVFRQGTIDIVTAPAAVLWRGEPVPLSPTEIRVFARIAGLGGASFALIDDAIASSGGNASSRRTLLYRIRQKFQFAGAPNPFQVVGRSGLRISTALMEG
jgi:hypothetical protein